jgi:hypothetical protein
MARNGIELMDYVDEVRARTAYEAWVDEQSRFGAQVGTGTAFPPFESLMDETKSCWLAVYNKCKATTIFAGG